MSDFDAARKRLEAYILGLPDAKIPSIADIRLLLAEVDRLKASVKRWEDQDVHEAMDCFKNQERAEKAEAELAQLKESISAGKV